ncbi:Chloroperoxidase [Mycena albidolilacea]|uniref:Chloroperoxidase n=1 Tax=Mycena albidolilacea TaxID=1033008 RepID=A0AAD6ZZ28_9AGAR|nr:Chloroperoxidase [Mycena albidolilacea]
MRLSSAVLIFAAVAQQCAGFPSSFFENRALHLGNRTVAAFDPAAQLIDVTGDHAFEAPNFENGDLRGPCPGLNAMANHKFIPHNGIVPFATAFAQSKSVFGLGVLPDTAVTALAIFGADVLALDFSIGGAPPSGILGGLGLLGNVVVNVGNAGRPTGLSGTHNQFESDNSPTRGDFYQFNGNNHDLQLPYFESLYNLPAGGPSANHDRDIIQQHARNRYHQSVSENPYFFYGPVEMVVSCAVHNLVYAMMANHSAECPQGCLTGDVLKSIYAVTTLQDGSLHYTPGHERIPDKWYRRPVDYGLDIVTDLVAMWLRYPELLIVGGNVDGVNTFAPIDIGNLTGGVYSTTTLLEGNNAACFVFQAVQILVPDALSKVAGYVSGILGDLLGAIKPVLDDLACPELSELDTSVLERYPGYKRTNHAV